MKSGFSCLRVPRVGSWLLLATACWLATLFMAPTAWAGPPVKLAAGWDHACGIEANQTVKCWGGDWAGQLGNGTPMPLMETTSVAVSGLSDVLSVSSGYAFSCAVKTDGSVWCWGSGDHGQLGSGSLSNGGEPVPVQVQGLPTAVRVVAGWQHACAKTISDEVYCWGANDQGQLGNPSVSGASPTPVPVLMANSSPLGNVADLAAGWGFTCARQYSGQVLCWGANDYGQLGIGSTTNQATPAVVPGLAAKAITAGWWHACALPYAGGVECWGANGTGQLGDGTTSDAHSPVAASALSGAPLAIAAGVEHTCARLVGGTVDCWGANGRGQLGDGSRADQHAPVMVPGLTGAQLLTAGGRSTCVLLQGNNAATCWGSNDTGQLGDGILPYHTSPDAVPGMSNPVTVSVGRTQTCSIDSTQQAWCWGGNRFGQFGDGTTAGSLNPQPVSGGHLWGKVAAGMYTTCGIDNTNKAWCWGGNSSGQLGLGATTMSQATQPQQVTVLGAVQDVAVASLHACAVQQSANSVWCWGANSAGQLGDGTTTQRLAPVQAGSLAASAVVTGNAFSCALKTDQTVWCWGSNGIGQLGDNQASGNMSSVPVQVHNLSDVIALTAGFGHACALKSGTPHNTVWCWGGNYGGRLGDGTTTTRLEPVQVAGTGLTAPTAVAAGTDHSCALDASGSVYCWGGNYHGVLGTGTTTQQLTPTAVTGLTNAVAIAAGPAATCAVRSDNTLACWGDNSFGQLGSNPPGYSTFLQPVQLFRGRIFTGHFEGSF